MRSYPSARGSIKPMTTKLAPNVGPMAGGRSTTSSVSSRLAGRWPTAKSYEKGFLFVKEQQRPYNFYKVADRPTPAVHHTITRQQKVNEQCTAPSQSAQKTMLSA